MKRARKKLNVWGGLVMLPEGQTRVLVATKTQAEAAQLFGESVYHFREHMTQTFNKDEIALALGSHGVRLYPKGRGNR